MTVELADGNSMCARRLLIASGLVDVLPSIPGLVERWGRDVVHCPYCHGWEVRDQAIGIVASGPASFHHALLFRQLSDDLVYFANGTELADGQRAAFSARNIRVVEDAVTAVAVGDDKIVGLRLRDGRLEPRAVIAVATHVEARVSFAEGLGLMLAEHPSGMGSRVHSDEFGRTEIPGVWVAGNVTDLTAQVGASAAAGATAAAHLNADLVAADTEQAVAIHRRDRNIPSEPDPTL